MGQTVQFLLHLAERSKGRIQHILHRISGGIDRDLGDQPHAFARGNHHLSLILVQFPGEDLQQGGLAAAVGPKQANPFPRIHLKREPVEYFIANLKFLNQIGYGNIDHSFLFLSSCGFMGPW